MSSRKRLLIVLGITLAVAGGAVGYTAGRMHRWHQRGWAGVFYSPQLPGGTKQPQFGAKPGEVVMTYGGAPADGALRSGDLVVSVGGVPLPDLDGLQKLDAKLALGDTVVYRVNRGGKILDVPVRLASPLRSPFIILKNAVAFLVAAVFVGVALVVFIRRPDDQRAIVFYAFALVSAMAVLGSAANVYESAGGRGISPMVTVTTLTPIFFFLFSIAYAPLILHLSLIFPRERPIVERNPHLIRWIYAGALLAVLTATFVGVMMVQMFQDVSAIEATGKRFGYLVGRAGFTITIAGLLVALQVIYAGRREGIRAAFARRPFRAVLAIFALLIALTAFIGRLGFKRVAALSAVGTILLPLSILAVYPICAVVALARSYSSAGIEEKRQVKWPMWGLLIALSTKIVATTLSLAGGILLTITRQSLIEWRAVFQAIDLIPTLVALLIPLSFAAAILKYRLMNIDVIIRKTVVYAILSGAIIVLYLALVGGLGTLLVNVAGLRNQTMVIASTLVVALLFVPLRNKLQTLVDRNLFRHKYDYPQALAAIAAETRTAADLTSYVTMAAEQVQQALQNRAVVVFTEKQDDFVATAKIGVSDALLGRLRLPRGFDEQLDRPFDPRRRVLGEEAAAAIARIEASLIVPIGGRGFMALAPKLSGGEFDVEDIDFLRSVADQITMAIDRIRMQVEEEDFAQARTIQQSLLPREMPRVQGVDVSGEWLSARTMGGDYYDLLELGDQRLAICIGDVAGKGMPAALLMSGLQAAVRAIAGDSPRDLCERVRRVVVPNLTGGRFVTFFYATVDVGGMRLRWCNAGHNAPILARADGSVLRLDGGGPAFSRLFRNSYEEHETALNPGDRIVLFTDGASEAADGSGELFGEDRLADLVVETRTLSARAIQQTIVDATTSFSGGDLEDDLTLVVVAV